MKGLKINDVSVKAKQGLYGIVFTSWNPSIVQDLLKETKKELISQGVDEANIYLKEVPGAFELPLATQFMAEKEGILSVISLGAIIRGDTPHFDFISSSCLEGLQEVSLKTRIPVICGVLTTNTIEQAEERSDPKKMNKGKEFALTALNMVDSLSWFMKSKKDTSPVRSRDKVIQSLYEIELSGSDIKELLTDLSLQSRYPHYKDCLLYTSDAADE